eukprot:4569220-Pyramimonas_sp.AAC.1
MTYRCIRCGYRTGVKGNLTRHLKNEVCKKKPPFEETTRPDLHSFGDEDISFLFDESDPAVSTLVKSADLLDRLRLVYFNRDYPKNQVVRKQVKKEWSLMVYKNGEWVRQIGSGVLDEIYDRLRVSQRKNAVGAVLEFLYNQTLVLLNKSIDLPNTEEILNEVRAKREQASAAAASISLNNDDLDTFLECPGFLYLVHVDSQMHPDVFKVGRTSRP